MTIGPGATLGGYYLERVLGSGGMGTVYLARHPTLPRFDALKVLWPHLVGDPEYRARFEREANLAAALDHPNIVSVQNRGEDQGCLWIALQYVNGTDAASALEASPGGLAPERALRIVAEIGQGLDHAHRAGLLHRDIKPANFLLAPQQHGDERVLLADFGIAKPSGDATELTRTGTFLATVAYASPEQLSGGPLDSRTDVYSLGASFYRLVTGQPPFPGTQAMTVMTGHLHKPPPRITAARPDLPAALDDVLARVLAKDPGDRFATCLEFTDAAADALAGRGAPPSISGAGGESDRRASAPAASADRAAETVAQQSAAPSVGRDAETVAQQSAAPSVDRAAETVAQQFAAPVESEVRPFARLASASDAWIPPDTRSTSSDVERTVINSGRGEVDQPTVRAGSGPRGAVVDSGLGATRARVFRSRAVRLSVGIAIPILILVLVVAIGSRNSRGTDDPTAGTTVSGEPTSTTALPSMAFQNPCALVTPELRQRFELSINATALNTATERKCSWRARSTSTTVSIVLGPAGSAVPEQLRPNVTVANAVDGVRVFTAATNSSTPPSCSIEWRPAFGYIRILMQGGSAKTPEAELCSGVQELADRVYPAVDR
ncbi:protein kinase [Nocardia sp. NPDC005978]|uniref:protein kinase domain-containing protein n=1 Tax=Nocardia sp. NPDC005978 TaxID=3156725 RepID=UPI0033B9A6D2